MTGLRAVVDDCKVIVLPLQELKDAAAGVDSADALLDVQKGKHSICPLHSTHTWLPQQPAS